MEKNEIDLEYLLSLPLEEYQQELGRLLVAAMNIATEEVPNYEKVLTSIKETAHEGEVATTHR